MQKENSMIKFLKNEIVLVISIILAIISSFFVKPGIEYIAYIDWNTLALLFCLMAVMKGFQKAGVFILLGEKLLTKANTLRKMMMVLTFLPFFTSMFITNDIALITFVPFGIIVLKIAKQEKYAVFLVIMQTIAANMGSTLTPMGNPQNLYLYAKSGIRVEELFLLMLPYAVISVLFLAAAIITKRSVPIQNFSEHDKVENFRTVVLSVTGFCFCLLSVFKFIPCAVVFAVIFLFLLLTDRKLLLSVDYALLGTFAALFIFIGNLSNIETFQAFISNVIENRVLGVSILTSQIISNVPAALLLSGFSSDWNALIAGCNLGGLGTLIASMASLISYKAVAREFPEQKKKYLLEFTLFNVGLLLILVIFHQLI